MSIVMKKQQKKRQSGFSLVEMVVYIAVLILIVVGSITLLFGLEDMFSKYRAEQLVFRSSTTALERILHDIREASTVDAFSYGGEGSLTLTVAGDTIVYATSSDAIHRTENGTDQGAITDEAVSVTELRFYGYASTTELARIEMTMSAAVGETTISRTFNAGAVLRGSYEQ